LLAGLERKDKVHTIEIPALAVSSSMIRERLAAGQGVRYLVPEGVAEVIEKSGVYAGEAARKGGARSAGGAGSDRA
ncbi:MAG: nicotinate-nucleotide adenylyltransferase, partial [Actinobacteria bacterium]|nr:nicotinate-nucleotide adenylyltransferase [Actinomycetota bacterium]